MALVDHDLRYFGSVFGHDAQGIASYLGIYRGAKRNLGIQKHVPRRVFGIWPKVAVLVEIHWAPPRHGMVEALWEMTFNTEGRIRELSILWDPRGCVEL